MSSFDEVIARPDATDAVAEPPTSPERVTARSSGLFQRRRNRIIVGCAVTAVVLASGTGVVYAVTRTPGGEYRTASAEIADVTETLALSGQLASSSSSNVAFQVAGTVSSVLVTQGDDVTAGQQLATLDTTDLEQTVTSAEDAVADAEQRLEDDLEAQTSTSSTSSSASADSAGDASGPSVGSGSGAPADESAGSGAPTGATPDSDSDRGDDAGSDTGNGPRPDESVDPDDSADPDDAADADVESALAAVTDAQQALLERYEESTTANEASATAIAQAQEVCSPFLGASLTDVTSAGADDADDPSDDDAEDAEAADDSTDEAAVLVEALQAALASVQGQLTQCQSAVATSQQTQTATQDAGTALTEASAALDAAVAELRDLLDASEESPADGDSSDPSGTDADDAAADAPQQDAVDDTTTPSLSVDTSAATGSLTLSTALYTNTSAVTAAADTAPSAGSSNGTSESSSGTVTAEDILADRAAIDLAEAELAVAQQELTFANLTSPIAGTVVAVAMAVGDGVSAASDTAVITIQGDGGYVVQATVTLSKIVGVAVGQTAVVSLPAFGSTYDGKVSSIGALNVSTSSTPSYTVTVAVDAAGDSPRIGATADVAVQVANASDVLTVPTSAITRTATGATVAQLVDGTTQTVPVTIGALGAERTEIIDGLSEGDAVVLADLSQAITSDDESTDGGLTGLGGSGDEQLDFRGGRKWILRRRRPRWGLHSPRKLTSNQAGLAPCGGASPAWLPTSTSVLQRRHSNRTPENDRAPLCSRSAWLTTLETRDPEYPRRAS